MTNVRRIRIVAPSHPLAALGVRIAVAAATGRPVRLDLQELESDELVVELSVLLDGEHPGSGNGREELARRLIRRSAFEVLSVWDGHLSPTPPRRRCDRLLRAWEITTLPVALRATLDATPTAQWNTQDRCWMLAVPCRVLGERAVALSRRSGYSARFSASDAAGWPAGPATEVWRPYPGAARTVLATAG